MTKKLNYKTPDIEITSFAPDTSIMANAGDGEGDDIVTGLYQSEKETDIPFDDWFNNMN